MMDIVRRNAFLVCMALGVLLFVALSGVRPATAESVRPLWSPPFARVLEVAEHFRAPEHEYAAGHRGIDVPARVGEGVAAPVSGVVSFSGRVVDRDVVSIRVDPRTIVSLEPVTSELREGDEVEQGSVVGAVGSGGHCDVECLHIGVRVDGVYVNPLRFYTDRPVLLPW